MAQSDLPATLLIPGLLCSPQVFAGQLAPLWQLGPVMVADHRSDDRVDAIARRVLASAPPRFALAGISMGGYVALELMRRAPQRVTKLVLLCTSARPDAPAQTARRREQIDLAEQGRLGEVVAQLFPSFVRENHPQVEALRTTVQAMAGHTGAAGFVNQQKANIHRIDSRASLAAIACPTLVVAAKDDAAIPPEAASELAREIPNARLVTLADCGHLCTLEHPDRVAREMVAFLSA